MTFDDLERSPELYGLPHPTWRPAQLEAFSLAEEARDQGVRFAFADLPTGSGKSGIATALGQHEQMLVLTHTLNLLDQYERDYGFSVVKGRQEYDCRLQSKVTRWAEKYDKVPKVSDCHFDSMPDCPVYEDCPYVNARNKAVKARRAACTYRFAALSKLMQERTGSLGMDEVHGAADELLEMGTITITEDDRKEFSLPPLPFTRNYGRGREGKGDVLTYRMRGRLKDWFHSALGCVSTSGISDLDPEEQRKIRKMRYRLSNGLDAMISSNDWFLEGGPWALKRRVRRGKKFVEINMPGMRLRPMSSASIADRLWQNKKFILGMSATIGNPKPLASELGITDYEYWDFPHPVPIANRPIYDLGCKRMTWDNLKRYPNLYKVQAILIAQWIKEFPPEWRGLILTSSFAKMAKLAEHLTPIFGSRLDVEDWGGTDMSGWMHDRTPGKIALQTMQGWGQGIDLYGDKARMLIMAGVPFNNPSDPYIKARQRLPQVKNYYWWLSYMAVPQACGRVSRGETNEDGSWLTSVSAIADGSATTKMAGRHYPGWFKDAIQR